MFLFSSDKYPGVKLLFLIFWVISVLFSTMAVQFAFPWQCTTALFFLNHCQHMLFLAFWLILPSFPKTTYWRDCLFSSVYSCLLYHRLSDHKSVDLSLNFLSCFIDVCFCFFCYHTVLITVALQYSLKSGNLIPTVLFPFSRQLWLVVLFCVSIKIIKL